MTLCSIQRHTSQTLRPDHSVCWRLDQQWNFLIQKVRIQFWESFRSFNKRVLLSSRLWTVFAFNRDYLEFLRPFFSYLFDYLRHIGDWNFLHLCQPWPFLAWVIFKGIFDDRLAYNLRSLWLRTTHLGTLRPSNVVHPDEQPFCWRSAALISQFSWSSRATKWIFQFLYFSLCDTWRSITFYKYK